MTRFRLTIEFNGQPFMGWQRQNHGPSVQQVIEDAAKEITGEDVLVYAAGRTDAGVHAEAMVAHVDIAKPFTAFRLMEGLNARMRPHPVAIIACEEVAHDWHARFSCLGRRYIYRIVNRRAPLALDQGRAWRVPNPLDADLMHEAAQLLVGTHDFTTFRSVHCQSESAIKSIDRFTVTRIGEEIELDVEARSFLHHQVRSMTGCLMLVGKGQWSIDDLRAARDAKDRTALGFNAPPDGLYFIAARY